jgi:hypothetical protein
MAILQNTTVSGSLVITGDLTARQFILSSSVTFYTESFSSGSTRFGDSMDDTMVVTGSLRLTGSIGVNTAAPAAALDTRIPGESAASGKVALIAATSNGNNDIFRWFDGTTQLGVFKNSGAVGIGTTSPSTKLNILVDGVGAEDGILIGVGSQGDGIKIVQRYLSNRVVATLGQANYSGATDSGALRLYDVGGTETIRLSGKINVASFLNSSGGNVGIGTTSPANKLHVESASGDGSYLTTFQTTTGAADTGPSVFFGFHDGTTARDAGNIRNLKENGTAGNYATYMSFATRANGSTAAEKMRITSAGNVGIGTTNPARKLDLLADGVKLGDGGSFLFDMNVGASSAYFTNFQMGSTNVFRLRGDGAHFLSSFTYNNTISGGVRNVFIDSSFALGGISSIRASKKNIQEFNPDWIYQLEPVQFNYRKKDEEGNYTEEIYDEINYGLIAEDTAPVADFLINYNDKEDSTKEMVGIEYMRLITPMLKAIQELKAENDSLKEILTRNNIA